jgi:hypothetical protein
MGMESLASSPMATALQLRFAQNDIHERFMVSFPAFLVSLFLC